MFNYTDDPSPDSVARKFNPGWEADNLIDSFGMHFPGIGQLHFSRSAQGCVASPTVTVGTATLQTSSHLKLREHHHPCGKNKRHLSRGTHPRQDAVRGWKARMAATSGKMSFIFMVRVMAVPTGIEPVTAL